MRKSDSKRNFKNKIEEKINNDEFRVLKYLKGDKYSNEIHVPVERYFENLHIYQIMPFFYLTREGKYNPESPASCARPNYFYITNQEKIDLNKILHKFHIPKKLYDDFVLLYIGIILNDAISTENTLDLAALKNSELNFLKALDFINSFSPDNKIIKKIKIDYETKSLKTDSVILEGGEVSNLFDLIFRRFLESNDFKLFPDKRKSIINRWADKSAEKKNAKNPSKKYQLKCAGIIYEYMRTNLYAPAYELRHDSKKCKLKIKELKRKYSKTVLYDLLGELFVLSGINFGNKRKGDALGNIKKKLTTHRKNHQVSINQILNGNSKDELKKFEFALFCHRHFN